MKMADNKKSGSERQNEAPDMRMFGPGRGRGGPPGMRPAEKPKNLGKVVKRLIVYLGKNNKLLIALLVIMLFTTAVTLAAPVIISEAINIMTYLDEYEPSSGIFTVITDALGIADRYIENSYLADILKLLLVLAVMYCLSSLLTYFQGRISAKLSQKTVYGMRKDLFEKIEYLPIKYTDTHKHGDIMSRMTNDVENISNTVSNSVTSLFSAVITLIGSLVIMLMLSWQMTLVAMVTIPITIVVSAVMGKLMHRLFSKQQRLLGELNGQIEESVTGYRTIVAYGREDTEKEKFSEISTQYKKNGIVSTMLGGIMGPIMNVTNNLNYLIVAAVGAYFALRMPTIFNVGLISAFLSYSKQFTRPINEIANQYSTILTAVAGAERVFEILDSEAESGLDGKTLDVDSVEGNISFEHVTFGYNKNEVVLKDFCLDVKAGEKIAIVGKTGSGKTTVVNLLTRFYDIDSGRITLDGHDITEYSKRSLRHAISIVLQDTVLFSDTVSANISYAVKSATKEQIESAARTANAARFIEQLPEGYMTMLSRSGENLSQGQRQLISIARAVLADPKILILDEATSSVDTRTEMQIQTAMQNLMEGRTTLIIAHRLSTIKNADRIIVIDDGRIVEIGNHEELLAAGGAYSALYKNQFEGFAT